MTVKRWEFALFETEQDEEPDVQYMKKGRRELVIQSPPSKVCSVPLVRSKI